MSDESPIFDEGDYEEKLRQAILDKSHGQLPSNRFWEEGPKAGRKRIYENPEDLRTDCYEYFEWVDDNNIKTQELVKFKEHAERWQVPKMRAMTVVGLCNFLGISRETWYTWRNEPRYSDICSRAEAIMFQQKFEGAAAGLLNHAIIARELGLKDHTEHTHGFSQISEDDDPKTAAQKYADTLRSDE